MRGDEKKCPDCAEIIKKDAAVCKHCGHKFSAEEVAAARSQMRNSKAIGWGALVAVVLLLAYCVDTTPATNTSLASGGTNEAMPSDAFLNAGGSATEPSRWSYREDRDEMRNRTDKFAETVSENEQDFDFPYNGGSHVTLRLQKFRSNNTDAIFQIDKGQFICHSFTGGRISVKFDNGPIRRFGCNEPSDGDTTTIFVEPAGPFLTALRKSSTVTLEAEFYQEGVRQFTFKTEGLRW